MTDAPAAAPRTGIPILEARGIGRSYGAVDALEGVSTSVLAGEVTCVLGDNGAGKSTLIRILAGAETPSEGELLLDGAPVVFSSPRAAQQAGIATVYQDLAVVPVMPVWRNFFLGAEITTGRGPLRRLDARAMKAVTRTALADLGIGLRDVDQPIGTLSGGERQSVAIARAVHVGARVLILDEPTAALGVTQSGRVLEQIARSRDAGLGVVLITHNPHHAYPMGDRFLLLRQGRSLGTVEKSGITIDELTRLMAGGAELDAITDELGRRERRRVPPAGGSDPSGIRQTGRRALGTVEQGPPGPQTRGAQHGADEDGLQEEERRGRLEEGRLQAGRVEEGRVEEGGRQEGRREEGGQESRREEGDDGHRPRREGGAGGGEGRP